VIRVSSNDTLTQRYIGRIRFGNLVDECPQKISTKYQACAATHPPFGNMPVEMNVLKWTSDRLVETNGPESSFGAHKMV